MRKIAILICVIALLIVACGQPQTPANNTTFPPVDTGNVDQQQPTQNETDIPPAVIEPDEEIAPVILPEITIDNITARGIVFSEEYFMNRYDIAFTAQDIDLTQITVNLSNPYFTTYTRYSPEVDCRKPVQVARARLTAFGVSKHNDSYTICVGTERPLQALAKMNINILFANQSVAQQEVQLPQVLAHDKYVVYDSHEFDIQDWQG